MSVMEERQCGDVLEHRHDGYDYWHPATRVHAVDISDSGLPIEHILARVVPYSEEVEVPRGLQVQPFDWASWDAGCEAKGICQGYTSFEVPDPADDHPSNTENILTTLSEDEDRPYYFRKPELHHRHVHYSRIGLAEPYYQCPHCRQLQKPIQWVQGARLVTYNVEVRGNRTVIWAKVSSGAWFVLITHGTLQGVARGHSDGTVYFCGIPDVSEAPPQQLPDECATILARRMWYRLTNGYWSDRKKEDDC